MSSVEVIEVRVGDDARIAGAAVDTPSRNSTRAGHALPIAGWVAGQNRPAVAVDVLHAGEVLRSAPLTVARQDVLARLARRGSGARLGFSLQVGLIGLPAQFELELRARLDGGGPVTIASIRCRRDRLVSGYEPTLRPLLVTSLARTGTSRLMRLLAHHPAVVADRDHPYETRIGRYWAHAFSVLAQPGDHTHSADPDNFGTRRNSVGHNPYFFGRLAEPAAMGDWFGRVYPERLAAFFQSLIDSFYGEVARRQGNSSPQWFAEKHLPDRFPPLLRELYPDAREVFLVRDPRDMAASMLAFNRKRGRPAFGSQAAGTDDEFIRQLRPRVLRLKRAWEERGNRAVLVRYEDLILSPAQTLATLFERLSLGREASPDAVLVAAADGEDAPDHKTSDSAASSIGRWRRDLAPQLHSACAAAFDDIVEDFGYERALLTT